MCACVYAPAQKRPCNNHHKQEEIRLKAKPTSPKNTTNPSQLLIAAGSVTKLVDDPTATRRKHPASLRPGDSDSPAGLQSRQCCCVPCCVHHLQPHSILPPRASTVSGGCFASSTHAAGAQRGRSTDPHGCEVLMLQEQSMEGSSSQRDLAGLRLHGTKAKAKRACCERNEEDISGWITLDEGLATGRNKLTSRESCLAGSSHDSDRCLSGDKHRAAQ